jgi:drug/metabolite transporter (DMT)-like permease
MSKKYIEFTLLIVLALLWGSSYLLTKIAVTEISPISLVSLRVLIATIFLFMLLKLRKVNIIFDLTIWRRLFVQSFFNSIGAWTVLAWGQQYVGSAIASVLNSTAPLFVLLFLFFSKQYEKLSILKVFGAVIGVAGVYLAIKGELKSEGNDYLPGMLACLLGAFLYGMSAIYGRKFESVDNYFTAFGTMFCASVVLVPAAFIFEDPLAIAVSMKAALAVLILSVFCTAAAFILYFRLIKSIGPVGVASQAYLRVVVGVILGIVILEESINYESYLGIVLCLIGVIFINTPIKNSFINFKQKRTEYEISIKRNGKK